MRCVLCGRRAVQQHHVVYRQHCRGNEADPRNLVPVCKRCHERHHNRTCAFSMALLPESVFVFAREVLGAGPAYEYLSRRYRGGHPLHDALIQGEG